MQFLHAVRELTRLDSMATLPASTKSPASDPVDAEDQDFHIILPKDKTIGAAAGAIVGGVVAGPVGALIGGVIVAIVVGRKRSKTVVATASSKKAPAKVPATAKRGTRPRKSLRAPAKKEASPAT
jgi:hypothetical protein